MYPRIHSLIPFAQPRQHRPSIGDGGFIATCVAHYPEDHAIEVMMRSGQKFRCSVGTDGPNDALRIHQGPLPGIMTDGLVMFPHGNHNNAVWIASISKNKQDAITTAGNDGHGSYNSHWSGAWDWTDSHGNHARVDSDGTSFVQGFGGTIPTMYRHVINAARQRVRAVFSQSQRNPNPQAAMPRVFTHISGATLTLSAAGAWTVASAPGQPLTFTANGGVFGLDANGVFHFASAGGMSQTSTDITIAGKPFLAHEHTGVTPGGGNTGAVA